MLLISVLFLFSLLTIFFPLMAILGLIEELKFTVKSQKFKGRVVDFERVRNQGWVTYAPVVDWVGPDGKTRRVQCGDPFAKPQYEIGQQIIVLLGPYKKDLRVRIKSFREQFLIPFCFLLFSLVALGIYAFCLITYVFPQYP
jgi:hypothetical protein